MLDEALLFTDFSRFDAGEYCTSQSESLLNPVVGTASPKVPRDEAIERKLLVLFATCCTCLGVQVTFFTLMADNLRVARIAAAESVRVTSTDL